ncbi:hypothetical protein DSECCO2_82530 [anaerobic digester metagenome]
MILDTAEAVITVSNSNRECIKKLDVITQVEVIPNGFRHDQFHPMQMEMCRRTLGLPVERKIILSVGNLIEVKGHTYLIDAMSEVTQIRMIFSFDGKTLS